MKQFTEKVQNNSFESLGLKEGAVLNIGDFVRVATIKRDTVWCVVKVTERSHKDFGIVIVIKDAMADVCKEISVFIDWVEKVIV